MITFLHVSEASQKIQNVPGDSGLFCKYTWKVFICGKSMDNRPLSKMAAENSNVMLCHVPLIVSLGYLWRRQQGSTGIMKTL